MNFLKGFIFFILSIFVSTYVLADDDKEVIERVEDAGYLAVEKYQLHDGHLDALRYKHDASVDVVHHEHQ